MLRTIAVFVFIFSTSFLFSQSHKEVYEKHHANGKLLISGFILEGENHGLWKEYNKQGKLLKQTLYDRGEKVHEKVYNNRFGYLQAEYFFDVHPNYGYVKEYTKDGYCWREQYGRMYSQKIRAGNNMRDAWGPRVTRSTKTGKLNYFSYFLNLPFKPELKIEFPIYNFLDSGQLSGVILKPQYLGWHRGGIVSQINGEIDQHMRVNYRWNDKGERVNNGYRPIANDTLVFDMRNARNQLQYSMKDGMPDGRWVNYYPNGRLWFVQDFENGKLHGVYEAYYIDGQKRYEAAFENGLLHGSFKEWYANGQTKCSGTFKQGMLNGKWTYYTDRGVQTAEDTWRHNRKDGKFRKWTNEGILILDAFYQKDKLQGYKREWHPNGNLKIEMYARDQYQEGPYKEYAENGQLIKEYFYNHGLLLSYNKKGEMVGINYQSHDNASTLRVRWDQGTVFDMNYNWSNNDYVYVHFKEGKIHESRYRKGDKTLNGVFPLKFMKEPNRLVFEWKGDSINGEREGRWQMHYPTGQLWIQQHYKAGKLEGPMEVFNIDGQLIERTVFSNNQKEGLSQIWSDDGTIISESHYRSNLKEGTQKVWHPNGKLKSISTYQANIHHGEFYTYDLDGKPTSHYNYQNGKKNGINKYYKYPEGFLWAETTYLNDVRHGEYRLYFENGQLRTHGHFLKGKKHGTWMIYDENGVVKDVHYFRYGQQKLAPIDLACQCDANYLDRGKTVFFPSVNSYAEYLEMNAVINEHLIISKKMHQRTFSRSVYPNFRHSYGSISMELMNFDTLHMALKAAPHMRFVFNPCLKSNQISNTQLRADYQHRIKQYNPSFDQTEFKGTTRNYFDILCDIHSYNIEQMLNGYTEINGNGDGWNSLDYKAFLKQLYRKKIIEKSQYKQSISPEKLVEYLEDTDDDTYDRFLNFMFKEVFGSYANVPTTEEERIRLGSDFQRFFGHTNNSIFRSLNEIDQACKAQYRATISSDNMAIDIPKALLKQMNPNNRSVVSYKGSEMPARFLFKNSSLQFNNFTGVQVVTDGLECFTPAFIGHSTATLTTDRALVYSDLPSLKRQAYHISSLPQEMPAGIYIPKAKGSIKLLINGNEYLTSVQYQDMYINGKRMEAVVLFALDNSISSASVETIKAAFPKDWQIKDLRALPSTNSFQLHFVFESR